MRWSIRGCAMTDLATDLTRGRSLWADAWGRLKANKAAVASAIYLALIVFLCLMGPSFTGHQFSTIYQSYVRIPPSFQPYPKVEALEAEIQAVVRRAHLDLKGWKEENGRFFVTITSSKPIDERVTRYLDRSDSFQGAKVESKSADGLILTMSAEVKHLYFYFGTDTSGRDLLTRTLVAGRV